MIILDTNVISGFLRREAVVLKWLDREARSSIWTTSISVFESRLGVELLPLGRRRLALEAELDHLFGREFVDRIIAVDDRDASCAATIAAAQQRAGLPMDPRDALIAGSTMARKAALATRNTRHFVGARIQLIDPWSVELG